MLRSGQNGFILRLNSRLVRTNGDVIVGFETIALLTASAADTTRVHIRCWSTITMTVPIVMFVFKLITTVSRTAIVMFHLSERRNAVN